MEILKFKKIYLFVFFLVSICFLTAQTLNDQDKEILKIALNRSGLELSSLNFLKDWSSGTRYKLPEMLNILNNPLEFPPFTDDLAAKIEQPNREILLSRIMEILSQNPAAEYQEIYREKFKHFEFEYLRRVNGYEGLFDYVSLVWKECDITRSAAFAACTDDDLLLWQYLSTGLWNEPEDSLHYKKYYHKYNIIEPETIETDTLIAMIDRIDISALFFTAMVNRAGFQVLQHYLKNSELQIDTALEYESSYGLMRIGSSKNDLTSDSYAFLFDPAGNDSYLGRIETNWQEQPYFWHIDLKGDDYYHNAEPSALASVKGGIGILYDKEGNDVYSGSDYAASAIWGYAELWDGGGDDVYNFGLHSAGAATFGISLLIDESGRDSYRVTQYGEGFGSTLGFGAIIDYQGSDYYYAGGKYMHAPLAPLDYRSLSQGFGFGMRPDLAGGIGLIYDADGNDNYSGGVYSQAVAYWYALGIIYDKKGNDYYDAVYYPQGSGIHLAAGFLYDGAGEDHYYSKHGPGQGAAHDWAVGFLIDRAGNDHYSVEGGNGVALTNSVAIFLDGSGDDNYQRKEENNYGYSREARNTGGIGIFLDLGGNDRYPVDICQNDSYWSRGYYGIGLDTLLVEADQEISIMNEVQAAVIDSLADIKEIWQLAAGWAVGSNQQTVLRAAEILLKREDEAAKYIAENALNSKSGLAYRSISEFNKKSDKLTPYLIQALASEDSIVAKNSISLISEYQDSTYITFLKPFLENNKYVNSVLGALGEIECDESVAILFDYLDSPNEKRRVVVARSLQSINKEDSQIAFFSLENDPSFIIRTMVKIYRDKKANQ